MASPLRASTSSPDAGFLHEGIRAVIHNDIRALVDFVDSGGYFSDDPQDVKVLHHDRLRNHTISVLLTGLGVFIKRSILWNLDLTDSFDFCIDSVIKKEPIQQARLVKKFMLHQSPWHEAFRGLTPMVREHMLRTIIPDHHEIPHWGNKFRNLSTGDDFMERLLAKAASHAAATGDEVPLAEAMGQ